MRLRIPFLAILFGALHGAAVVAQTSVPVHGVVYDSLRSAPLAGALVAVAGSALTTISDAQGRFHFDSVPTGQRTFVAQHDSLEAAGFTGISARVVIGATSSDVRIALPSFATLWRTACGTPAPARDTGLVFGSISNGVDRRPVVGASVDMTWLDLHTDSGSATKVNQKRWYAHAVSDSTGGYIVCGVPLTFGVSMLATRDSSASGLIDLPPRDIGVLRRDLLVGPMDNPAMHGTVTGVLLNAAGGPFPDARIVMDEVPEVRSRPDGRFMLRDVPAGTRQLEILSIGMRPVVLPLNVVAGDTVSLSLTLHKITTLDVMRVTATSRQRRFIEAFEERRTTAMGTVRDSSQLHGTLSGAISQISGTTVVRGRGSQFSVMVRGTGGRPCVANFYVDGVLQLDQDELTMLRTEDLAAVEVYPALGVPAKFAATGAKATCGALAIWTKQGFQ